jgi:2-C-methyl-D-erythritol 4-phosphate cytidylyltransferase
MKQAFISNKVAKANKNTVRIIRSKVIKAQMPQESQLSRELLTLKLTKANENKQKFLDNRKLVALKFSTPGARSQVRETSWIDLKLKKVSEEKQ